MRGYSQRQEREDEEVDEYVEHWGRLGQRSIIVWVVVVVVVVVGKVMQRWVCGERSTSEESFNGSCRLLEWPKPHDASALLWEVGATT
jgi:hypothetical protein